MCVDDVHEPTAVTQRLLNEINRRHDTTFSLTSKAAGGMNSGAWLLQDSSRRRAVLKVGLGFALDHLRRAERAVAQIRSAGYPTPAWLAIGETTDGVRYQVQDLIPGCPADPLTRRTARLLVDLIELHAGLDPLPERDWSAHVLAELDARKEQLRRSAPATSDVVNHYEQLLAQLGPVDLPDGDLVHGDFNSCNVLVHHGQVSGAIDIETLGSGTRAIDYAWLLREAYAEGANDAEGIRLIRCAGEAVAGPEALAFCATFTAMEWLLWMVHHVPHAVPALLDGLHRLADDLARPWTTVR